MKNSFGQDQRGCQPSIHENLASAPAIPVKGHSSILDTPSPSGHAPHQDDLVREPPMEQFRSSRESFTWENGRTHREFEHGEIKNIISLES